jgi:hypothetical protein
MSLAITRRDLSAEGLRGHARRCQDVQQACRLLALVVEKINSHPPRWLRRRRLRANACHGVVSSPALQCRMIRG